MPEVHFGDDRRLTMHEVVNIFEQNIKQNADYELRKSQTTKKKK